MTDTTRPTPSVPDDRGEPSSPVARAKAEIEHTKETLEDAKAELGAAIDDKRGGPATSVDDAVDKSDALRRGIERDLAALRARIPDTDEVKDRAKTIGVAVGGGVVAIGTLTAVLRKRRTRKAEEAAVRTQAAAIARELAKIDLDDIAEDLMEDRGGKGKWLALLAAAGVAGAAAVWRRGQTESAVDDVFGPPGLAPEDIGPQGIGPVTPPR